MKVITAYYTTEKIVDTIFLHRSYLMGMAMLLIIGFHFFSWVYNPIGNFNIGYIGVDVFMFLSGMGLAYSYKNKSIKRFYANRFCKIYPLYFVGVLSTYVLFDINWSLSDLLANITTIGFYTKWGINRYDWYLESLFTLYLFFPIIYHYVKSKEEISILFILLIVSILLLIGNIPWWYDCFISRLPIFIYGIISVPLKSGRR